jgi:hypothetical protein
MQKVADAMNLSEGGSATPEQIQLQLKQQQVEEERQQRLLVEQ